MLEGIIVLVRNESSVSLQVLGQRYKDMDNGAIAQG